MSQLVEVHFRNGPFVGRRVVIKELTIAKSIHDRDEAERGALRKALKPFAIHVVHSQFIAVMGGEKCLAPNVFAAARAARGGAQS